MLERDPTTEAAAADAREALERALANRAAIQHTVLPGLGALPASAPRAHALGRPPASVADAAGDSA
jgi:hypothetical protein